MVMNIKEYMDIKRVYCKECNLAIKPVDSIVHKIDGKLIYYCFKCYTERRKEKENE